MNRTTVRRALREARASQPQRVIPVSTSSSGNRISGVWAIPQLGRRAEWFGVVNVKRAVAKGQ